MPAQRMGMDSEGNGAPEAKRIFVRAPAERRKKLRTAGVSGTKWSPRFVPAGARWRAGGAEMAETRRAPADENGAKPRA